MDVDLSQKKSNETSEHEEHSHFGMAVAIIGAIILIILLSLFLYMTNINREMHVQPTQVVQPEYQNEEPASEEVTNVASEPAEERTSIMDDMPPEVRDTTPAAPATTPPNPSAPPQSETNPPAAASPTGGSTTTSTAPPPVVTTTTGGGGSAVAPPALPPPPTPAADVTITRNVAEEPASVQIDQGDATLFQFTVDTSQEYVDFEQVLFALTLGNPTVYGTADAAFQADPEFHFEKKHTDGSWFRLVSSGWNRYSGNIRMLRYVLDYGERNTQAATYRLVASYLPCELAGNSLDVSILDSRGNINALFDTPTTQATRSIEYAEVANPLQLTTCSSARSAPRNPVVWLQFEEGSGTLYDSSGYENHTTVQSGLAYANQNTLTNSIRFVGGATSYVEIPHNQGLAFSDPVTIEAYINPDVDGVWQGLVSKGNGTTQYDYHVAISPNNKLAYYTDFGGVWYEGSSTLPKNAWKHIAVTVGNCAVGDTGIHKGCELNMYVNGQKETVSKYNGGYASAPDASSITLGVPGTGSIAIGAWSGSSHIFSYSGFMDDLVIYNRVLPDSEIIDRYRGTR